MPFRRRIGQVCKWVFRQKRLDGSGVPRRDFLFVHSTFCFFFYWRGRLIKKLIYCVVPPSLFWSFHQSKTSTKHKRTIKPTFKRDPVRTTWVPADCRTVLRHEGRKNTHQMSATVSTMLLSEVPSLGLREEPMKMPHCETWKVAWYVGKQPSLPCRLALLACWCDWLFPTNNSSVFWFFFFLFMLSSCVLSMQKCTEIKGHLGMRRRDENHSFKTDPPWARVSTPPKVKVFLFFFLSLFLTHHATRRSRSENNL